MAPSKTTGSKAAIAAVKTVASPKTWDASKTAAASVLSQVHALHKQTHPSAASAAAKVLRNGRTTVTSKTAAGSALSQTPLKKK